MSLCLPLSPFVYVCVSLPVPLSPFLYLYLWISVLPVAQSPFVCLSVLNDIPSVSHCLTVSLFLCLSVLSQCLMSRGGMSLCVVLYRDVLVLMCTCVSCIDV